MTQEISSKSPIIANFQNTKVQVGGMGATVAEATKTLSKSVLGRAWSILKGRLMGSPKLTKKEAQIVLSTAIGLQKTEDIENLKCQLKLCTKKELWKMVKNNPKEVEQLYKTVKALSDMPSDGTDELQELREAAQNTLQVLEEIREDILILSLEKSGLLPPSNTSGKAEKKEFLDKKEVVIDVESEPATDSKPRDPGPIAVSPLGEDSEMSLVQHEPAAKRNFCRRLEDYKELASQGNISLNEIQKKVDNLKALLNAYRESMPSMSKEEKSEVRRFKKEIRDLPSLIKRGVKELLPRQRDASRKIGENILTVMTVFEAFRDSKAIQEITENESDQFQQKVDSLKAKHQRSEEALRGMNKHNMEENLFEIMRQKPLLEGAGAMNILGEVTMQGEKHLNEEDQSRLEAAIKTLDRAMDPEKQEGTLADVKRALGIVNQLAQKIVAAS